jgi:predicted Rdx family selenoprotein
MDRIDCAYLINTTPKYFYLLPLHIALLQRYASMAWPIYIATEAPELLPCLPPDIKILRLPMEAEGFLDSRAEATRLLPPEIKYVFPMQEDFLLEGRPMAQEIASAFEALEEVDSVRLMPCPGPKGPVFYNEFKVLDFAIEMVFTYQATLWKREAYGTFMNTLLHRLKGKSQAEKNRIGIKINIAENVDGQAILRDLGGIHLSVIRQYPHPNAVYLCPWPYRPTAVVQGVLQPWAIDLGEREGFQLNR